MAREQRCADFLGRMQLYGVGLRRDRAVRNRVLREIRGGQGCCFDCCHPIVRLGVRRDFEEVSRVG